MSGWRDKGGGIAALAISAIAAYLFLAIGARCLGAGQFAPLGALWSVVFLGTAALAAPLEIETARRVGAARGRGDAYGSEVRASFLLAGALGTTAIVAALLLGGSVDGSLFAGQSGFAVAAGVAFAGLAAGAAARGACAGAGRLTPWGVYLLVDGGSRCALAAAAAILAPVPAAFAASLAAGPWIAMLALAPAVRGMIAGAPGRLGDGLRALVVGVSPLVVGAAASSILVYLGAILLPALAPGPDGRVGAYIAALSVARLPLFALSPAVAIAVPRIAASVARGDVAPAARAIRAFVGLTAVAGTLAVLAALVAGSGFLGLLFGRGFAIPAGSLAAVAMAAATWLVATAAGASAVAAGRSRLVAAGWCAGVLVAVVAAALPGHDPFVRTDLAIAAGGLTAAVAVAIVAAVPLPQHARTGALR